VGTIMCEICWGTCVLFDERFVVAIIMHITFKFACLVAYVFFVARVSRVSFCFQFWFGWC